MNGTAHRWIGATSGAVHGAARIYKSEEKHTFETAAPLVGAAAAGGLVGGMLPDLLEPATSPNHRGIAHSIIIGIVLVGLLYWFFSKNGKLTLWTAFFEGLVAGTVSHLAADSTTAKSLPLLT